MNQLLSTKQAAKIAKVKQGKIVRAIQKGKLSATKIGWTYAVDREDLKKFMKEIAG